MNRKFWKIFVLMVSVWTLAGQESPVLRSSFTGDVASGPVTIEIEAMSVGWHTVVIAPTTTAGACTTAYPAGGVWARQSIGTGLASIAVDASGLAGECLFWAFAEPSGGGPPFFFSEECGHITFCEPPSPPALTTPSNGYSTNIVPINLGWEESVDADFYMVRISGEEWFTSWDTLMSHGGSCVFTAEAWHGLGSPERVYWKVLAGDYTCGQGDFSPARYFDVTVTGTVAAPSLRYPYNASYICDITPRFMWYTVTGADHYRVECDNNSDFSSPEIYEEGLASYYWDSPYILDPGDYWWRMYSHNSEGWSDPSATRTFTLGDVFLTLADPPDMSVGGSSAITWSRCGVSLVNLFYRTGSLDSWRVLTLNETNDGAWNWTPVANTPTDSAQILIEDASDGDPSDISSFFRIIPAEPNIEFAYTYAPDLVFDAREEFLPVLPEVLWENSTEMSGYLECTIGTGRIASTNLQDLGTTGLTYRYGESGGDVWLQYWLYFTWADIPGGHSHFSDFRPITLLWHSANIEDLTTSPRTPDFVTGMSHFFRASGAVEWRGVRPVVYIAEGTHSICFETSDTALYYREYDDFLTTVHDNVSYMTRRRVRDYTTVPEWEVGRAAADGVASALKFRLGRGFLDVCEPVFDGIRNGGLVVRDGYSRLTSAMTLCGEMLELVNEDEPRGDGLVLSIEPGDTGYVLEYYDAQEWRNYYGFWGPLPDPVWFPSGSPKTPYFSGDVFSDPAGWCVVEGEEIPGVMIDREGGLSGVEIVLQDGEGRVAGLNPVGEPFNMLPGGCAMADGIYLGQYAAHSTDRLALRITRMSGTGDIPVTTATGDTISIPIAGTGVDRFAVLNSDWGLTWIDTLPAGYIAADIVDPTVTNSPPGGDTITSTSQLFSTVRDSVSRINLATGYMEIDSTPCEIFFDFADDRLEPAISGLEVGWHTIETEIEDLARNMASHHSTFYWDTTPPPECDWLFHLYSGGSGNDGLYSVAATDDSGFVVAGLSESFGVQGIFVARYNSGMDRLWSRYLNTGTDIGLTDMTLLDGSHARGCDIAQTDAGFMVTSTLDGDVLALLLDETGSLSWAKTIAAGDGTSRGVGVARFGTGGCVVTNMVSSGDDVVGLLYLDAAGNILSAKAIDYAGNYATAIEPAFDGGLFITGLTAYHEGDMLIMRLDNLLDIDWMRAIGATDAGAVSWAEGVTPLTDGGSIVCGWTDGFGAGDRDGLIFRLDDGGFTDWIEAVGTADNEHLFSTTVVEDSFIVAVGSHTWLFGLDGAWLGGYNETGYDVAGILGRRFIVCGRDVGVYGGFDFTLAGGDSSGWMCTGMSSVPIVTTISPDFNFRVLLWETLSPTVTPVSIDNADLSLTAEFTCKCDTTAPSVNISCTGDTLNVGIAHTFTWTITDDFLSAVPCSVYISGCGIDIADVGTGSYTFTPDTFCEHVSIEVVSRDVWMNRGSDICWFRIDNACFAELFDISVLEETDCDDHNLVEICYTMTATCVESSYVVEAAVYPDSAMDWTVPFTTRRDDAGDLGPGIEPGTHCFVWDMGADWHGASGDDFRLVLSYLHEGRVETAETTTAAFDTSPPVIRIGTSDVSSNWVGSTYTMNFTESEANPTADPYTVSVSSCAGDTTFTLPRDDHSHPFPVTVAWGACDTVYFVVSARDSFCNVGLDSLWLVPLSSITCNPANFGSGAVFSCPDFAPSFTLSSHCPIDTVEFYVNIDGDYYTVISPEIELVPGSITFTPSDSLFWSEGTHNITVHLEDVCGNALNRSSTIVADYTPPVFYAWGPSGEIPFDTEWLWVALSDAVTNISDLRIEIGSVCEGYILGPEDVVSHGDTLFIPIESCEDIVEICVKAWDNPAICDANADSVCWSYFLEGVIGDVERHHPQDVNDDGMIVSNCADEYVSWSVEHTQRLDLTSIGVTVNGEVFLYPTFIEFSRDTVYFSPDTGFHDSEPLEVCLRYIMDISGTALETPCCDTIYFDRSPPELVWADPAADAVVYDTYAIVDGLIEDRVCPSPWQYIWIEANSGAEIEADSFPLLLEGLVHGDTAHVFIITQDTWADYCAANQDTIEWDFFVDLGAPRGQVLEPVLGDALPVSACSTQVVRWRVTDPAGLDTLSPFFVTFDGTRFERDELLYYFSAGTLFVTLDPDFVGLDISLYEGDTVTFCLDSVRNIPGFGLRSPICASFVPDFSPPVFYGLYPPEGFVLFGASIDVAVSAFDSICGDVEIDSISVRITPVRSGWVFDGSNITGLVDGDRVWITAHAGDGCPTFCGPNLADTTWGFDVVFGSIYPTAAAPADLNGDGRTVTGCNPPEVRWSIFHTEDIDTASAAITLDGDTISSPIASLHVSADSVEFVSDTALTEGEHTVCLVNLADITGAAISSVSCISFIVDTTSSEIVIHSGPADGSTIYSDNFSMSFNAYDSECDLSVVDSITVMTPEGSFSVTGDSVYVHGLLDGDAVTVTAWSSDICRDYDCGGTVSSLEITVFAAIGGVSGHVLDPLDLNSDGMAVSTCDTSEIRWLIVDEYAIEESSIEVEIDGTPYEIDDESLTFSGDTLIWSGHLDDGPHTFCLTQAVDITGDSLRTLVCGDFVRDTEGPYRLFHSPTGLVTTDSILFDAAFRDDLCGDSVVLDSLRIVVTDSIGVVTLSMTTNYLPVPIIGISDGDSIAITAYVRDRCADYCADNTSSILMVLHAGYGIPTAELLLPIDSNGDGLRWSACDPTCLMIGISDSTGLVTEGLAIVLNGSVYHSDDLTPVLSPDSAFMEVEICTDLTGWLHLSVDSAFNRTGQNVSPVIDSVFVYSGLPEITYIGPISTISDETAHVSFTASDSICDDVLLDSMTVLVTSTAGDTVTFFSADSSSSDIHGLSDGDNVLVCVEYSAHCADTCGPLSSRECREFGVVIGEISATALFPRDFDGDSRTVVSCTDGQVGWRIRSVHPVDTMSISVIVCGETIGIEALDLSGDLLTCPLAVDSCEYCLIAMSDTLGNSISTPICMTVLWDTLPPVIIATEPYGTLPTGLHHFSASAYDSGCGDEIQIVHNIRFFPGGDTTIVLPEFDLALSCDSLHHCVVVSDMCADTCGSNIDSICNTIFIDSYAPTAGLLEPLEGTISSCRDQTVIWLLSGDFVESSIRVSDGSSVFNTGYPGLYLVGDRLVFEPVLADPLFSWPEGEVIEVCIDSLSDSLGNSVSGFCASWTGDYTPPDLENTWPGGIISDSSTVVRIDITDALSGLSNMWMTLDGDTVDATWDGSRLSFDTDGWLVPADGGIVMACAGATDNADICPSNAADTCWQFSFGLSGPVIRVLFPPEGAVVSCREMAAYFVVTDPDSVDKTIIEGCGTVVEGFEFRGDTLIVSLSNLCDTVTLCIRASDYLGNMSDTVCISFLADTLAPLIWFEHPPDTTFELRPLFSANIFDSISGIGELEMVLNGSPVDFDFDGLSCFWQPDTDLALNTLVRCCITADDDPDYCPENIATLCREVFIQGRPDIFWADTVERMSPVIEGDTAMIVAFVTNDSLLHAGGFTVGLFEGSDLLEAFPVAGLGRMDTATITAFVLLPAGDHELCFAADLGDSVIERDEDNNVICVTIDVAGTVCGAEPNPFSPTEDGINDVVSFTYPHILEGAEVSVFSLDGVLLTEFDGETVWDGRNRDGSPLSRGVYLYTIKRRGEVICTGTLYLVR